MSHSLEEETLYYLIAAILLFGGPVALIFGYIKFDEIKSKIRKREQDDKEFLEKYGQQAYNEMLKQRALNKPSAFSTLASGPLSGIWYSRAAVDKVIGLVQANHETALIGNAPHRLTELAFSGLNQLSLSGQWAYPKNPSLTTIVQLSLEAKPMADGRTGVTYKYKIVPEDDPFAQQIATITNHWLKDLIEKAS